MQIWQPYIRDRRRHSIIWLTRFYSNRIRTVLILSNTTTTYYHYNHSLEEIWLNRYTSLWQEDKIIAMITRNVPNSVVETANCKCTCTVGGECVVNGSRVGSEWTLLSQARGSFAQPISKLMIISYYIVFLSTDNRNRIESKRIVQFVGTKRELQILKYRTYHKCKEDDKDDNNNHN